MNELFYLYLSVRMPFFIQKLSNACFSSQVDLWFRFLGFLNN